MLDLKLVLTMLRRIKMPIPNGQITTTKIMQGLDKGEQCQDKTGQEVSEQTDEATTPMQSQSQSE
jgi:hypothetical protein